MFNDYEVFTKNKTGVPVLATDLVANAVFTLGAPVQSLGGLNGFLTEVSSDGLEGVMDIGAGQVYSSDIVLAAGNKPTGTPIYYDTATGGLTDTVVGNIFGLLTRISYDETFPIVGGGTTPLGVLLVN